MKNLKSFMKIIFPEYIKCIVCSKELNEDKLFSICDDCLEQIPFISGNTCIKCGMKLDNDYIVCLNCKDNPKYFERHFSVLSYTGVMPKLVQDFKFNKKKYLSVPFSKMMLEKFKDEDISVDLIMPVPIHQERLKERGYNQSELLLKEFECLSIPILKDNLQRIKYSPQQAVLTRAERRNNLVDAFVIKDKSVIKGKTILVVDDIYTTGSTLNEVSKTLIKAGASKVFCLTLCHASYYPNI